MSSHIPKTDSRFVTPPALIFAVCVVLGHSFALDNTYGSVFGSKEHLLVSALETVLLFLFFYMVIRRLFAYVDSHGITGSCDSASGYRNCLQSRPFITVFATLFLAHLPNLILSYPGKFMGDTSKLIQQGLLFPKENILSAAHPVVHTLLLSLFTRFGKLISNDNAGIFLYCLFQFLIMEAVTAFAVSLLVRSNVKSRLIMVLILYYCVNPLIIIFLPLLTKDIIYGSFFLLFYAILYRLLTAEKLTRQDRFLITAAIMGCLCFRNEGKLIVLGTFIPALLYRKFRKRALCFALFSLFLLFVISGIVSLLHPQKGSVREVLSVPFQQTARYVRDAESEITEHEKEVIDSVLDYHSLAEKYDPNLSDDVKATYKENNAALKDYFKVWLSMFFRHPSIYFQATVNNYYQYFYPGSRISRDYTYRWAQDCMDGANSREKIHANYYMPPALDTLRTAAEQFVFDSAGLPVFSLFLTPAFYTWAALLFLFYSFACRKGSMAVFSLPTVINVCLLVTLVPANGYYGRYQYAMALYLPVVCLFTLLLRQQEN